MGDALSTEYFDCASCSRPENTENTPLQNGFFRISVITSRSLSISERRKRAKSYENVFRRETTFFCQKIRQPSELGSRLLARHCINFDDITRIDSEKILSDKNHVLLEIVTRKNCFIDLYEILLEDESPLVCYLEIKRNSKKYISDAEFVNQLGMKALLTDTDTKVLQTYYGYITKNTTNADDIFTNLYQSNVINEETLDILHRIPLESAKMKHFIQNHVSRWTYEEMKKFCTKLMDENSHVAKLLWPIVFTADPDLRYNMANSICSSDSDSDLQTDTKNESVALKLYKDTKTHRKTSVVLGNHGAVTSVVAGSIRMTMTVKTCSDLEQVLQDIKTGCIQHRFKQWIASNVKHFSCACVVKAEVSCTECDDAKEILERHNRILQQSERLPDPVQFGFCKERDEWFWSPDSYMWIHVSRLFVPSGEHRNKAPRVEDVETIQFLSRQQLPVKNPVTPCAVCTMGKFTVKNENIYEALRRGESIHSGVPITITFKIYKKTSKVAASDVASDWTTSALHTSDHGDQRSSTVPLIRNSANGDIIYSNTDVGALPLLKETVV